MFNKLPVLLYLMTISVTVSASRISSPLLVSPTPEIISYSSSPVAVSSVKSYQTVTTHPAPVRYVTSPVTYAVRPKYSTPVLVKKIPTSVLYGSQYVAPPTPVYVQNIEQYAPVVTKYATAPTFVKYASPVITKTVAAPVIKYVKAPSVRIVENPAVSYIAAPVPVVQKYSSVPVATKYVQNYVSPAVYVKPVKPIPVPVEYPAEYTPVPVAYAKESYAVPTYAKAHSYSSAPLVSRVSFNGRGASYVY